MFIPSLFLLAFLNMVDAMEVKAFLEDPKHASLAIEMREKLDAKFETGNVYRGETLELILAILFTVPHETKKYTPLPESGAAHHVRETKDGVITPAQVRAEIKAFISHAVGPPGPNATLRAVVVGNVAYEECKKFLEETLTPKVGTEASPGDNHLGKNHGQAHVDELERHFQVTLMHHETPELADAAAHYHTNPGAITDKETPHNRVTPGGYIEDPILYRTEIRRALKKSQGTGLDMNGIAHAALERAKEELEKAREKLVKLNGGMNQETRQAVEKPNKKDTDED